MYDGQQDDACSKAVVTNDITGTILLPSIVVKEDRKGRENRNSLMQMKGSSLPGGLVLLLLYSTMMAHVMTDDASILTRHSVQKCQWNQPMQNVSPCPSCICTYSDLDCYSYMTMLKHNESIKARSSLIVVSNNSPHVANTSLNASHPQAFQGARAIDLCASATTPVPANASANSSAPIPPKGGTALFAVKSAV